MPLVSTSDWLLLASALIIGLLIWVVTNYLALFGIYTVGSDVFLIWAGVLTGFGAAIVSRLYQNQ